MRACLVTYLEDTVPIEARRPILKEHFQAAVVRRMFRASKIIPVVEKSRLCLNERLVPPHPIVHALNVGFCRRRAFKILEIGRPDCSARYLGRLHTYLTKKKASIV